MCIKYIEFEYSYSTSVTHALPRSMLGPHLKSLLVFCVQKFGVSIIFGGTCHLWSLSWIVLVHVHGVASSNEVQSDLIKGLALIKSNLDSAITSANALQIILVHLGIHNVLHVGHSPERLLVEVLGQSLYVNVNDLLLGEVRFIVILPRIVSRKIGGEEVLLLLLGWSDIPVLVLLWLPALLLLLLWLRIAVSVER